MIEVYFTRDAAWRYRREYVDGFNPLPVIVDSNHYEKVATIERSAVDDLDAAEFAFLTCQNGVHYPSWSRREEPWLKTGLRPDGLGQRSMQVGDVVVVDGRPFIARNMGFAPTRFEELHAQCKHCDHFIELQDELGDRNEPIYGHLCDGEVDEETGYGDPDYHHAAELGALKPLAVWEAERPDLFLKYPDGRIGPNSRFHEHFNSSRFHTSLNRNT